ncbi:MAG: dolichyl-phosphate-mannose-protein mannosyltransferase [Parcubacteria group bacterium LiPW_41]|nr:MAG: dolichyl-phosphate-mannose-protein mannosyltransferase [Parcubacteria group bacterium LiPW_41]
MKKENKIKKPTEEKKRGLLFPILILIFYVLVSLWQINSPFIHVTEDIAGTNGVASQNINTVGFLGVRGGYFNPFIRDTTTFLGTAYTHHPQLFLIPTAILYSIFGVSEVTTRLGLFLFLLVALIPFFFALRKVIGERTAALSLFIFSLLPGAIYYGKSFELTMFAIPAAMIVYSLFIFFFFEKDEKKQKRYLISFFIATLIGAQFAWFFYFLPIGIWIFLFTKQGKTTKYRNLFLSLIPVALIISFGITMLQFFLLNGAQFWEDFKNSFFVRTSSQPINSWFSRIWWITNLNVTWLFFISALLGVVVWYKKIKQEKNMMLVLPILILPVFTMLIFRQWSTHPFGMILFFPIVAIFCGLLFEKLISLYKDIGIGIVVVILILGGYLSYKNLNFFYEKFLILGPNDISLLKQIGPQIKDDEVCLGTNPAGIGVEGIIQWYMKKNITILPQCGENTKIFLAFHPAHGKQSEQEAQQKINEGFGTPECADILCMMEKGK